MQIPDSVDQPPSKPSDPDGTSASPVAQPAKPVEIGGRKGPDPTRYGDWEKDGRCIDF
jgi:hypothetical protein